jgi:carbon storage regulator
MLVLSRKKGEGIMINDDIYIEIIEIRSDKVRLGVEAPKEVPVHRKEVYDAIRRDDSIQFYNDFRQKLRAGNFEEAFDLFYENKGSFGTRGEINSMVSGLKRRLYDA